MVVLIRTEKNLKSPFPSTTSRIFFIYVVNYMTKQRIFIFQKAEYKRRKWSLAPSEIYALGVNFPHVLSTQGKESLNQITGLKIFQYMLTYTHVNFTLARLGISSFA